MMSLITIFATSFIIAFSGAMMPGPFMSTTIGESARRGPWVGPKMIVGHALLELALLFALFFGLAPLFTKRLFFVAISLAGGAIMIWMAHGMFRELRTLEITTTTQTGKPVNLFVAGIAMSLANPYWIIWWATVGLGYLVVAQKLGFMGVVLFFVGHILGDLVWYSAISFAVGKGRQFFSNTVYRVLVGVCATFLSVFALWMFVEGIESLFNA